MCPCCSRVPDLLCVQVVLRHAHNADAITKGVNDHGAKLASRGLRSLGIARASGESSGMWQPKLRARATCALYTAVCYVRIRIYRSEIFLTDLAHCQACAEACQLGLGDVEHGPIHRRLGFTALPKDYRPAAVTVRPVHGMQIGHFGHTDMLTHGRLDRGLSGRSVLHEVHSPS